MREWNAGSNDWFVLFRFFDIVKPPPIGWVDRTFKGGTGVMADDLMAGFMTLLTIALWRTI
jgi:phosphatidylglycerophosphatase A